MQAATPERKISFHVIVILLILSLINTAPAIFFHLGADIFGHMTMIDCFTKQFWQGDIYPRWCFSANGGLGAPAFIFYAPLPYYVTALFRPLGFSLYQMFVAGLLIANIVSAFTCYSWLRDTVISKYALIITAIFLFLPYRMEVMLYRTGYSELWEIAFLPLVFKYTQRLIQGEGRAKFPLAAAFACGLLCNVPSALIGFILSGIYMLAASGATIKPKLYFAAACLMGFMLAGFYMVPGAFYTAYAHTDTIKNPFIGWSAVFVSLPVIMERGLWRPAIMMVIMIVSFGLFAARLLTKNDPFIRRDVRAYSIMAIAGLFLTFSISQPIYTLLGSISNYIFPWRMQVAVAIATTALLARWMKQVNSPKRLKTLTADMTALTIFLILISYFQLSIYSPEEDASFQTQLDHDTLVVPEYQTRWMEEGYLTGSRMAERNQHLDTIPKAVFVKGTGDYTIARWRWSGMELAVHTLKEATLRLDHNYFPIWKAGDEKGNPVSLHPEAKTGQMLIDVPAGDHTVIITPDIASANHLVIRLSEWISLASLLLIACGMYFERTILISRFDKP